MAITKLGNELIKTAGTMGFNRDITKDDEDAMLNAYLKDIDVNPGSLSEQHLKNARRGALQAAFFNTIYLQETGKPRDPVNTLMNTVKARKLSVPPNSNFK